MGAAADTGVVGGSEGGDGFEQYPDTRSQVYRGVTGESVRSDAAVSDTSGRIVTYGGVPEPIREPALALLDPPLRAVVEAFTGRFGARLRRPRHRP